MKKIAFMMLALLSFAACDPEPEDNPQGGDDPKDTALSFTLTNSMVKVGVEGDCLIQTDNASKSIYIEVDYMDHEELAALEVSFEGLPDGITADPNPLSFDFSSGATATVIFSKDEKTVDYTVTAEASDPDPHFTSFKLNGIDVSGGQVKLIGSAKLTQVKVEFTVSPADTKVYVGETEIVSSTEEEPTYVDFSDKANGVTFTLKCASVTKEETFKVVTTGIQKITRVWGRYLKAVTEGAPEWWLDVPAEDANVRTMSMDDKFIYLARTDGHVYRVSITDPTEAIEMNMGSYSTNGYFPTAALDCIEDGNGGYITLLTDMVNAAEHEFAIWAWTDPAGEPTQVLTYKPSANMRIGDEMSVEGTWKDGKLWFHNFSSFKDAVVFSVKDGVINPTPARVSYSDKQGNWGAIYKYDDTQYIGGGVGNKSILFTLADNMLTKQLELSGAVFAYPLHGIRFFSLNEQSYMIYVNLRNSWQDGQMRITELNGETLKASLEEPGHTYVFGIGDPVENDITAYKNGNGCGGGVLRKIDGVFYYAAHIPGAGLSLFKIE